MNSAASNRIQLQVRLPVTVAFEVVWQGIRIRLGRSLVTMMGVVFGVAFLMSVFSANTIRRSIADEQELRQEVQRMLSFLEADTGLVRNRHLGVLVAGTPNAAERRLLAQLQARRVDELRVWPADAVATLPNLPALQGQTEPEGLGAGTSGIVLLGAGPLPPLDWSAIVGEMRQPVLAYTRDALAPPALDGLTITGLVRALRPDEIERQRQQEAQDHARNIWIVSIALLVTVIGITNSLLMSVTERFREIGTMKCLGALSAFIRQIFFIESALMGLFGSLVGGLVGFLVAAVLYAITFGFGLVFQSLDIGVVALFYLVSVACGVAMSILAAIYPASFASRMVPATALRSNI